MNYELIQNFITVAKTKNITHSAEILFVAQSTVSHRLQQLEEMLGYQLIFRNKGKRLATLTEHGKAFLPIAEKWMSLWEETESFRSAAQEAKLVIGCVNSLVVCLLRDLISNYIARYPNTHLQVKTLESDDIFQKLKSREVDIGITLMNLPYQNVNVRPFLSEKMCCICKKGLLPPKRSVGPGELLPYEEILLNWGIEFMLWHNFWFNGTIVPRLQVNTIILIEDMLKQRDAWAIVPETVATYFVSHGVCDRYELKNPPPNRTSYVVTPAFPDPNNADLIRKFEQDLDAFIADYCKE